MNKLILRLDPAAPAPARRRTLSALKKAGFTPSADKPHLAALGYLCGQAPDKTALRAIPGILSVDDDEKKRAL